MSQETLGTANVELIDVNYNRNCPKKQDRLPNPVSLSASGLVNDNVLIICPGDVNNSPVSKCLVNLKKSSIVTLKQQRMEAAGIVIHHDTFFLTGGIFPE